MTTTIDVGTFAQLDTAITTVNAAASGDYVIHFTSDILESGDLTAIKTAAGVTTIINGDGHSLDGDAAYQDLFVYSGVVEVENISLVGGRAQGGTGGGGGAGLGGGLFVAGGGGGWAGGTVTLDRVTFSGNTAAGGSGGVSGVSHEGGSMSHATSDIGMGPAIGAAAGFGTGGYTAGTAGAGGFGGGGGTDFLGNAVAGGFGGGSGSTLPFSLGGGGGLGAGGDVFVQQGGSLIVTGGSLGLGAITGGTGGTGAQSGSAYGSGIFLQGDQTLTLAPTLTDTITIVGDIADQTGSGGTGADAGAGSVVVDGPGTVDIQASNHFSGGLTLQNGTVSISGSSGVGEGAVTFGANGHATLRFSSQAVPTHVIQGFGVGDTIVITDLDPNGATVSVLGNGTEVVVADTSPANTHVHINGASGMSFVTSAAPGGGVALNLVPAAPSITIDTISGDDVINAAEHGAAVTISGTTTAEAGQIVTVGLNSATYTATVQNGGTWSLSVPQAAVAALADSATYSVTADVTSAGGTAANQATRSLSAYILAPSTTISTISGDDVIAASEHQSSLTISGVAEVNDGYAVSVTLNGHTYTTTTLNLGWSLTVPLADVRALAGSTSYTVEASISDAYGNSGTATRSISTGALPTITPDPWAGDGVMNATEHQHDLVLTGTTTGVAAGQIVTVFGSTWTGTVDATGHWSITIPASIVQTFGNGSGLWEITVSDVYGNAAPRGQMPHRVDTVAPTLTVDPFAGDDIVNAVEQQGSLTVSGASNAGTGRSVDITLGGDMYTATIDATGHWSTSVPHARVALLAGGPLVASVSNSIGNTAQVTHTIGVDTVAPTLTLDALPNGGVINAAAAAAGLAFTGTSDAGTGQVVTVTLGGHSYTGAVDGTGHWSVSAPAADLANLTDGSTYSMTVDVSDPAGNPAITATPNVTVHSMPPSFNGDEFAGGDDVINATEHNQALVLTGTTSLPAGRVVTITFGGQTYTGLSAAGGVWSVTVPQAAVAALADGAYAVAGSIADPYGNTATISDSITVDTAIPSLTNDTISGDDVINTTEHGQSLTISGLVHVENGQILSLVLNGHTYTSEVDSYEWSVTVPIADVAALVAGSTYTVSMSATNLAGNVATRSENVFVASAPTITLDPIGTGLSINAAAHTGSVAIGGTTSAEAGQTVTVTLNGVGYYATVGTGGVWSITVTQAQVAALADGTYTLGMSVTDVAGNVGTVLKSLVVDTVPPSITLDPLAGDGILNAQEADAALTVGGTSTAEAGQVVTVTLDGVSYTGAVDGTGHWSASIPRSALQALTNGSSYRLSVGVSDQAGNAAEGTRRSLSVQTVRPSISIDTVAQDDVLNAQEHGAALTIAGSTGSDAGTIVTVGLNGHSYTATVQPGGAWSTTVPAAAVAALSAASYVITADVTNPVGSNALTARHRIMLQTTLPTLTLDPVQGGGYVIGGLQHGGAVALGGTSNAPDGQVVTVTLDGHSYSSVVVHGVWSASVPAGVVAGLADGSYPVQVSVADAVGNIATTAHTLVVDTTAAAAPTLTLAAISDSGIPANGVTNVTLPVFEGTAEAGSTVTVSLDGVAAGAALAGQNGHWSFQVASAVASGAHLVSATQTDLAGNVSAASTPFTLVETTPRDAADFAATDPIFDRAYYLAQNPDVAASGMDPLQHYETFGWKEGRNPDAFFDTRYYLNQNPDVAASGMDPMRHYEQHGAREGRDPSAAFDSKAYLAANPDVVAAGDDALMHYIHFGQAENRMMFAATPHAVGPQDPLMDPTYYYAHNPDVAAAGIDATQHYTQSGWHELRNPDAFFDTGYYLLHNTDVAAAGINPLQHFEQFGWKEGRDPSAAFSTGSYLAANPDVAAAGIDPLEHYLAHGQAEGRMIFAAHV